MNLGMSFLRAYIVIKTVLATNTQAEISHTSEDIERDKFWSEKNLTVLFKVSHKTAGNKNIPTEFYFNLSTKLAQDDQVLFVCIENVS